METKQCYLLATGLSMTVIRGYLEFYWFMLDFHKYECYNLPHVTTCPGLPTHNLDFYESKWISRLKATNNINNTILPLTIKCN